MNDVRIKILLAMVACGLVGCQPFKPSPRVHATEVLPTSFSGSGQGDERVERWWEAFGSAELNALMDVALADSLTLKETWARLRQAEAAAARAGAGLLPELSLEASGSRTRSSTVGPTGSRVTATTKRYGLGLAATYEVDLWGRIRSGEQAAQLDTLATREALEAAAISLTAEVANRWVRILEQRATRDLLGEQLKTNRTFEELVELRFRKSFASAVDVYQQRQTVARVEAQMPLVDSREQVLLHELTLLLGKNARAKIPLAAGELPKLPPLPPTGLPSELLARRPDVRVALANLQAADYRVAAARADRLPAIRLTGDAGFSSAELEDLFDNWAATLAAGLVAPILDGGRRTAEVERTRGVVQERLATYQRTVLTAFKEVEDALVRERQQRKHLVALDRQIDVARNTLREARKRYGQGLSDYLPVLTALATVQQLERDRLAAQRDLVLFRISLYRALGGTWTNQLEPTAIDSPDAEE